MYEQHALRSYSYGFNTCAGFANTCASRKFSFSLPRLFITVSTALLLEGVVRVCPESSLTLLLSYSCVLNQTFPEAIGSQGFFLC